MLTEHIEGLGLKRWRGKVDLVHIENHQTGYCVGKCPFFDHRHPEGSSGPIEVWGALVVDGVGHSVPFGGSPWHVWCRALYQSGVIRTAQQEVEGCSRTISQDE